MNQIEVLSVFVAASLCIVIFILNRLYERAELQKSIIEGLVLESYKDKVLLTNLSERCMGNELAKQIMGDYYYTYLNATREGFDELICDERGLHIK